MIHRTIKKLKFIRDQLLEEYFIPIDKSKIRRTKNLLLVPSLRYRRGGKIAYIEWGHVIGIFQTIIGQVLNQKTGQRILDVGCGTGLLGIASESYVSEGGKYIGIDVIKENIDICKKIYQSPYYEFIHVEAHNEMYTPNSYQKQKSWPFADESFDLVTALSVWTHFGSQDAQFYIKEVDRVLKPKSKAIITFFYLNENYTQSLSDRNQELGKFNRSPKDLWIFDKKFEDSDDWLTPKWTNVPEEAIGITKKGLDSILAQTSLSVSTIYNGSWKERPGAYFQDIIILTKNG